MDAVDICAKESIYDQGGRGAVQLTELIDC